MVANINRTEQENKNLIWVLFINLDANKYYFYEKNIHFKLN
jgi:hypothetical protein